MISVTEMVKPFNNYGSFYQKSSLVCSLNRSTVSLISTENLGTLNKMTPEKLGRTVGFLACLRTLNLIWLNIYILGWLGWC